MSTTMLNHFIPAKITLAARRGRLYATHFDYMRFIAVIISYILDCFAVTARIFSDIPHHVYSSSAMGFARSNISARRAVTYNIARDTVKAWRYAFSERIWIFLANYLLWLSTEVAGRLGIVRSWRALTSLPQNIKSISHAGSEQWKWLFRFFDTLASASHRLLMLLHHVNQLVLPSAHTLLHTVFHLGNSESGTAELERRGLLRGFRALFYRHVPPFGDLVRAHIICLFSRVHLLLFGLCCRPQSLFGKLCLEIRFFGRIKNLVPAVSGAAQLWESFARELSNLYGSLHRCVLLVGEKPWVAIAQAFSVLVEVCARPDGAHCDDSLVESRYRHNFRLVFALFIGWMALRHLNRRIKNPYFDIFTPSDTLISPQVVAKIFLKGAGWDCIRYGPFFRDPIDVYVHNIKEYCYHMDNMIRVGFGTRIATARTYLHDSLLGTTQAWQEVETLSPKWDEFNVISTMGRDPKADSCAIEGLTQSSVKNNSASKMRTVRRYRKEPVAPCKPISKDEVCKCAVCKKRIDDVMESVMGALCGASV